MLPWFGGSAVSAPDGRWRLTAAPPAPGWYTFRIRGRTATPAGAASAPALDALPLVRGHCLDARRLLLDGAWVETLALAPESEPDRFAPVRARRWSAGRLLLEGVEFEDEAEDAVRAASESGQGLAGVGGIPATLRAAYGLFLAEQAAARLQVAVSALELRARLATIADGGREAAEAEVRRLDTARREAARRLNAPQVEVRATAWQPPRDDRFERRAAEALHRAGAELLRSRRIGGGQREVVYHFLGQRFATIVDQQSLQVLDAGICLSGADRQLTLESLPGVIREAVDTGVLYVTRRVRT